MFRKRKEPIRQIIEAIAVFTSGSVRKLRQTTRAQALLDLTARYQSSEMFDAMTALRAWEREHGAEFAHRFEDALSKKDEKALQLNRYRRIVTHYFHNVIMLYRLKVIDEQAVKTVVFPFQVDFLLEVIEPLERTGVGYNDIRYMFDAYRQIYSLPPYSPSVRDVRWWLWPTSRT